MRSFPLNHTEKLTSYLNNLNFRNQFFQKEHFWALRSDLWKDRSFEATKERQKIVSRFLELHDLIYSEFPRYNLTNVYEHYRKENITSSYYHKDGYSLEELSAIWLHYSKSKEEIQKYKDVTLGKDWLEGDNDNTSFSNHIRLQVIIHNNNIGVWLFIGKANMGSVWDRDNLQRLLESESDLDKFYTLIKALDDKYYMYLGNNNHETLICKDVNDKEILRHFWKKDRYKIASYIGRDFKIDDPALSVEQIKETVLTNFKALYPLYELIKHKMP